MSLEAAHQLSQKPVDRFIPRSPYSASNHAVVLKVMEDISFLKDRIERMKSLKTPNATVLKTYHSMLESRESVLEWLQEKDDMCEDDELEDDNSSLSNYA